VNAVSILILTAALASAATDKPLVAPFESRAGLTAHGRIDELAFEQWKRLGIQPANPCSDEVFVRRVYLDVIGTLPTPEEASQFLSDQDPNKRGALIDRLLERNEFADYWAMKWSDLLRVKSEFPINLWPNAVQAYYRWIRTSIKKRAWKGWRPSFRRSATNPPQNGKKRSSTSIPRRACRGALWARRPFSPMASRLTSLRARTRAKFSPTGSWRGRIRGSRATS
jgi:hypothetical protein